MPGICEGMAASGDEWDEKLDGDMESENLGRMPKARESLRLV